MGERPALFPCAFEGTIDDIEALDYLDYEGLGYPASGLAGAALVWGNVVARHLPFVWAFDDDLAGLVLHDPGRALTVWPLGRVFESQRSFETQFDKYRWLLAGVVLQCMPRPPVEDDRPRLLRFLGKDDAGLIPYLEYALKQMQDVRDGLGDGPVRD